jgi:hypothetical protein
MSVKEAEAALCKQGYKVAMVFKTPSDQGVLCWWVACGIQALGGVFFWREMLGTEMQARKELLRAVSRLGLLCLSHERTLWESARRVTLSLEVHPIYLLNDVTFRRKTLRPLQIGATCRGDL